MENKKNNETIVEQDDKIIVEPDERFPDIGKDETENKVKDKGKDEKPKEIKFGSKEHKKNIRKENRLKARYDLVRLLKKDVPEKIVNFFRVVSSVLDYALNIFILGCILTVVVFGVLAVYNGDWIRVACSGFLVVVLIYLNEKIV